MKYFSALVFILLSSIGLFGQAKKDSLTDKLDEYFTALKNLKYFNGNVIITKNGQLLLDKTYNITGETDSLKITKDSK